MLAYPGSTSNMCDGKQMEKCCLFDKTGTEDLKLLGET
ncbi:hypothetical protein N752_11800 [Desulforamulus aquiferis]|nr:hypothetical protein N752_11800 [Desulforamulus aquiferis]